MSTTETKTETKPDPKSTASTLPLNPFATFPSFDPMAMWTASQQTWSKLVAEGVARAEQFASHYAALEAQLISRAQGAVGNWAQLAQDAISYGAQLSAEARKLGLDTARQAAAKASA
jgi:hypothetical protein